MTYDAATLRCASWPLLRYEIPAANVCAHQCSYKQNASPRAFRVWLCDVDPRSRAGARDHRIDDAHVRDRVFERRRHRGVVADRARQLVTLDRVLIADLEADLVGVVAALVPDPAGPVGRRVERDLDLDPALAAEDVYALVGLGLRGDGERRGGAAKVEHRRSCAIGAEPRIELDAAEHAARLRPEHQAGDRDRITPDVQQRTAADAGLIADVARILVEVREQGLHGD